MKRGRDGHTEETPPPKRCQNSQDTVRNTEKEGVKPRPKKVFLYAQIAKEAN
ncbi:Hypothetical protein FKW44_005982 [Caligus rogercresseyi]|uniref:Uncharacterized protein n=1 Tax=Caligus rogercresseyi TaxID=217165 RepID=A0A7T8QSH6_CALRO|nr:Hypothetical protein FKW44_005982 [Caligus rogercresseyi]